MKKKHINASLIFCLLSVIFLSSACKWNKGRVEDGKKSGAEAKDIVSDNLDSLHVTDTSDSLLYIEYNFQYLKSNGMVCDSINASITQNLVSGKRETDARKAILNALVDESVRMKTEIAEYYEPEDETYVDARYSIRRTGHFHSDAADTVIVYKATIDMYTGGAHGSFTPLTLNFSRKTGHLLTPDDVFDMSRANEILDLMHAQLLKDKSCSTREELMEKTSLLTLGDLYLTPNFHLGKNAITFCFGQYDIAPYSCGITYISLNYDTISPFLKK